MRDIARRVDDARERRAEQGAVGGAEPPVGRLQADHAARRGEPLGEMRRGVGPKRGAEPLLVR